MSDEFTFTAGSEPKKEPSGKKIADHFATVRERGLLNASTQAFEDMYLESHPGMMVRWERYSPKMQDGADDVVFREGQGWKVVDFSELGVQSDIASKSGPVRRGDMILMAIDARVGQMYLDQDAEAAKTDVNAAKDAYFDNLDKNKVTRPSDGIEDQARGRGSIKVQTQYVAPKADTM